MVNAHFATSDEFHAHVILPRPLVGEPRERLFEDFSRRGYLARQEATGVSVMARFFATLSSTPSQRADDAPFRVGVVMLGHPTLTDEEFTSWVDIVQSWSAELPPRTMAAISRKIRRFRHLDRGVPLTILHKDMPEQILLSSRHPSDFVAVIEPDGTGLRSIYATKNIG